MQMSGQSKDCNTHSKLPGKGNNNNNNCFFITFGKNSRKELQGLHNNLQYAWCKWPTLSHIKFIL